MPVAIALLSGGLDSATAAAQAIADGYEVVGLSFDYGQRHVRELRAAKEVARILGLVDHAELRVDLAAWGGSALTSHEYDVPMDGVTQGTVPSTYVPGRNTVFIALALSLAEVRQAECIYLGINAIDYSGYPDCRPEYLAAFQALAALASKVGIEGRAPTLVAPLILDTKADIVRRALALKVPIELTWSCYLGQEYPCQRCDSCRIRDAALLEAGRPDLMSSAPRLP